MIEIAGGIVLGFIGIFILLIFIAILGNSTHGKYNKR